MLPTEIGIHSINLWIEISAHLRSSPINSIKGFQERGLIVERFARVGNEYGRDTQGITHNEGR